MTSLPSHSSLDTLHTSGTSSPSQPLAGDNEPLTVRPGWFMMTCSVLVGLIGIALIGFATFVVTVAIQRGSLREIGAVGAAIAVFGLILLGIAAGNAMTVCKISVALDEKQVVLPGAVTQGLFRKRTEARAERIRARINAMDPLSR